MERGAGRVAKATTIKPMGLSSDVQIVHGTKQYINGTLVGEEDPSLDHVEANLKKDQKQETRRTVIVIRNPTEIVSQKPSIMKGSTKEIPKLRNNMVTFKDRVSYADKDDGHSTDDFPDQVKRDEKFNSKLSMMIGSSKTKVAGFKSVGPQPIKQLHLQSNYMKDNNSCIIPPATNVSPTLIDEEIAIKAMIKIPVLNSQLDLLNSFVSGGCNVDAADCSEAEAGSIFGELEVKWQKIKMASRRHKGSVWRNDAILKWSQANSSVFNMDIVPEKSGELVTTLLRASREGNEGLIKSCLRDIIVGGISNEELNSTDKSGRTAVSYICSNGLGQFLDIMLQLQIDVNKVDNEGNSPLHFAAEAGRADIIHMLITRARELEIDPKNNLGFTPLMKAAIQGRIKCAQLLLFGGASPVLTDPKRKYRPDQWSRFCAQHSCADMIETCSRARLLGKTCSSQEANDPKISEERKKITRSNTGSLASDNYAPSESGVSSAGISGIRAKLRKVFPFGFGSRDKSKRSETSDLVSYLSAAALCASSGPALAKEQTDFIKKLIHHQDIPKLEVTYANNATLIKKYS